MTKIKMSEMTPDVVVAGTEKILVLDGTTSKTCTTAKMAEYAIDVLVAADAATPTTGDDFLAVRSGVEKRLDLDAVVTYAVAGAWSGAAAVTPAVTGDLFLMNRSGTTGTESIDVIKTYVLTGVQATVLNLSGLDTATLAGSDLFAICQTTTGKKVTLTALETKLWADYVTYVTGLTDVVTAADADALYCLQGGVAKKLTLDDLAVYIQAETRNAITADVWDTSVSSSSFGPADVLVFERSGIRRTAQAQYLATYVLGEFRDQSIMSPAADGDKVAMWRSTIPGTMTIDTIATYVQNTILDDWVAITPLVDSDQILVDRSGGKYVTAANLKTYVLTDIQETVLDFSTITSTSSPTGTDVLVLDRASTPRSVTLTLLETKLWADYATYVLALADAATVVDADKFYVINGTTPKYCTATELATYMTAEFWSASAAASVVTGNTLLIDQTGTMKEATVDQLATFVLTNGQLTLLNLTTLGEQPSMAVDDLLLVCQSGVPVYAQLDDVAEWVLDTLDTHITALEGVTTVDGPDLLYTTQSGTPRKLTVTALTSHIVDEANNLPWKLVDTASYTATPPSTSTITMSDTSDYEIGLPVKYTDSRGTFYAIVTAITPNALLTIAGAPLDVAAALTALYVGLPGSVVEKEYVVDTMWADTTQDLFSAITLEAHRWYGRKAYLVAYAATQGVADTGASQPKLNVKINTAVVGTEDSANGITLSATPGTWVASTAVAINTSNYDINRNEAIELACTAAGTNGDAEILTVSLTFVYE